MTISIPSDCKKFRTAIIPGAIWIFVFAVLGMCSLIIIRHGFHFFGDALAVATGCELILSFFGSWILSLLYPYAFSAEGIYGYSFWGRRRFVSWQDISSIRTFRVLNLPWLRVYAIGGKITWLGLFQSQDTEFRQEIRRLAPPTSPILNYV
jgi:hypothetical protein